MNMCVAQPSYTNPLHILQGINALLLPQLPLLLNSTEIQRVQVNGKQETNSLAGISAPMPCWFTTSSAPAAVARRRQC